MKRLLLSVDVNPFLFLLVNVRAISLAVFVCVHAICQLVPLNQRVAVHWAYIGRALIEAQVKSSLTNWGWGFGLHVDRVKRLLVLVLEFLAVQILLSGGKETSGAIEFETIIALCSLLSILHLSSWLVSKLSLLRHVSQLGACPILAWSLCLNRPISAHYP